MDKKRQWLDRKTSISKEDGNGAGKFVRSAEVIMHIKSDKRFILMKMKKFVKLK